MYFKSLISNVRNKRVEIQNQGHWINIFVKFTKFMCYQVYKSLIKMSKLGSDFKQTLTRLPLFSKGKGWCIFILYKKKSLTLLPLYYKGKGWFSLFNIGLYPKSKRYWFFCFMFLAKFTTSALFFSKSFFVKHLNNL